MMYDNDSMDITIVKGGDYLPSMLVRGMVDTARRYRRPFTVHFQRVGSKGGVARYVGWIDRAYEPKGGGAYDPLSRNVQPMACYGRDEKGRFTGRIAGGFRSFRLDMVKMIKVGEVVIMAEGYDPEEVRK